MNKNLIIKQAIVRRGLSNLKLHEIKSNLIEDVVKEVIEIALKLNWIELKLQKPTATETGEWDGKKTDFLLVKTISGKVTIAQAYIGFLDGHYFCDWYRENDYELNDEVLEWMPLPV